MPSSLAKQGKIGENLSWRTRLTTTSHLHIRPPSYLGGPSPFLFPLLFEYKMLEIRGRLIAVLPSPQIESGRLGENFQMMETVGHQG